MNLRFALFNCCCNILARPSVRLDVTTRHHVCPRILIPIKTSTHHIFILSHLLVYRSSQFTTSLARHFTASLARHLIDNCSFTYRSIHRASTSFASTYCMITCASHSEASILFTPHSVRTIGYRQNFSLELKFL